MATPALIEAFQTWQRSKDELAGSALTLAAQATLGTLTMEEVGALMVTCFAAGRLSLAQEVHDAELREQLSVTHIPGSAN